MVEKKNKEEEYSIGKCVAILESMEDLSEEEWQNHWVCLSVRKIERFL